MGVVTFTTGFLIFCYLFGESLSQPPPCVATFASCRTSSDCPTSHPVCDSGSCCLETRKRRNAKKVCPQTPPGINYMCAAIYRPDECSSDQECPAGKLCCFVACGPRKCHDAVEPPVSGGFRLSKFF